ncbi:MAG: prepilin-type N-terminal cleavage/methylation domain-containing protein [Campylobacterota bacterium]
MKKAFSLLEFLFVIVLIGIVSGIGFYTYRSNNAYEDAQYALLRLKEARYRAIGYDAVQPQGCVTLTEAGLEENTTSAHDVRSTITHTGRDDTVCFDALGRPHDMGYSIALESLTHSPIDITFHNADEARESDVLIRLFPQSGYAIIMYNN